MQTVAQHQCDCFPFGCSGSGKVRSAVVSTTTWAKVEGRTSRTVQRTAVLCSSTLVRRGRNCCCSPRESLCISHNPTPSLLLNVLICGVLGRTVNTYNTTGSKSTRVHSKGTRSSETKSNRPAIYESNAAPFQTVSTRVATKHQRLFGKPFLSKPNR